jgi:hypothetical protein
VTTRKIEALFGSDPVPVEYGNIFDQEDVHGRFRLRIGLDQGQDICVRELAAILRGPFQLLYVLHTSRIDSALGRYESPVLSSVEVQAFLHEFGPFLVQDSRHDLWVRSHDDDATIVLDRHNLIYAYGPLTIFQDVLHRIGVTSRGLPHTPERHLHHYHPEWDTTERAVLLAIEWTRKPLQEADVQFTPGPQTG